MTTAGGRSLWHHPDFRNLWAAQTISLIGSQVTFLALPLTAIAVLDASPAEIGVLTALGSLPALLVGLPAGAVVDRRRRRPILVGADLGRAALLALVPIAWALDALSLGLLLAVALLNGLLGLFFDVAYQALLPALLTRDRLVEGNSRLETSRTAAEIAGPGLAGWLIHVSTAPLAIAVDAASYVASALFLGRIRAQEPPPARLEAGSRLWDEIWVGVGAVFGDPRLRALAGGKGLLGLFNAMLEAVFFLFIARDLGVGPGLLGLVFAVGSVGFAVGSLLPDPVARRIGVGRATVAALALVAASDLLVPLASGSLVVVLPLLVAAQLFFGIGLTVFNVNAVSLRQSIVAGHLQGRASGTMRLMGAALVPMGALLGGVLGEVIGLRATLVVAAGGELTAAIWLWRSPLRAVRTLPVEAENGGAA